MIGVWKNLDILATESLACCKQSTYDSAWSLEDQTTHRNTDSKGNFMRFQLSTSLAIGLESMCATHWSKLCFHFAHVLILWNTEIKDVRLIDFAEEISKQMYNDNQE